MPALKPTTVSGKIIWLGYMPKDRDDLRSNPVQEMFASFSGFEGERHSGLTRLSCSRTSAQYKKDTTIRNTRQFSIVSAEELMRIAKNMGLEAIDPVWIGASIVVEGIPDFTHIPPSSRLQNPDGTSLVVDMENRPCIYPGQEVEKDAPGHGNRFMAAAKGLRGVTAWIENEGFLRVGDAIRLHIPDQPTWSYFDQARG